MALLSPERQRALREDVLPRANALALRILRLVLHPLVFALLALGYLYQYAYDYWDSHTGGQWRWNSTWPTNRTRFVLVAAVVPVWAAMVFAAILVYVALAAGWRRIPFTLVVGWPPRVERTKRRTAAWQPVPDADADVEQQELNPLNGSAHDAPYADNDEQDDPPPLPPKTTDKRPHRLRTACGGTLAFLVSPLFWISLVCLAVALFGVHAATTWEQQDDIRYRPQVVEAVAKPRPAGYHTGEKYYIAANFYNNEGILPRWFQEMEKVIKYLGTENVYVSIYESNSWDASPRLLQGFDETLGKLNVKRRVLVGDASIPSPRSRSTNRDSDRIPFLASVRNKVMEPLYTGEADKAVGWMFDRVLFLNDVYFEAESVVELLKTHDGDWHQVCGMDFGVWGMYDAWVIRDRLGAIVSSVWPYLFEDVGMNAMFKWEPAPVFSCWNGVTAMRAEPFYQPRQRVKRKVPSPAPPKPAPLSGDLLHPPLPLSHPLFYTHAETPPKDQPALRFRPSHPNKKGPYTDLLYAFSQLPAAQPSHAARAPDTNVTARAALPDLKRPAEPECFSSECFLVSYDMRRRFRYDRIFVNPRVVVAYDWNFYVWYKYVVRHWLVKWWMETWERGGDYMFTRVTIGPKEWVGQWDGGACFPF